MSRPGLLRRAAGTVDADDRRILLALLLFTLLFRLLTLMMIHTGVDERDYWFAARRIVLGLPYDVVQHRTIRFAVILPVAAAQALLGTHPDVYYVVPVLVALAEVALIYRLGVALHGRAAGFAAALMLALFPYMIRGGSQVRPDTFALFYVLASLSFFLPWLAGGEERRGRDLVLAAALLFLAYQAKITSLFFLPGYLAAIIGARRRVRDALLFCLPLLGLYAVEHSFLYWLSGNPLGQLGIIMKYHLSGHYIEPMAFWGLFGRYSPQKLPWYWMAVMALAVIASVRAFRRSPDPRTRALVLLAASFLFFETFAVAGLEPLRPVEPFLHRYLLPLLAPLLLLDAGLLAAAWRKVARAARHPAAPRPLASGVAVAILAALLAGASLVFSLPHLPAGLRLYVNNPLEPREHALALVERYRRLVSDAYARGIPVVGEDALAGRNALETCQEFFLSDGVIRRDGLRPLRKATLAGESVLVLLPPSVSPERVLASGDSPVIAARRNPLAVVPARVATARPLIRSKPGGEDQ